MPEFKRDNMPSPQDLLRMRDALREMDDPLPDEIMDEINRLLVEHEDEDRARIAADMMAREGKVDPVRVEGILAYAQTMAFICAEQRMRELLGKQRLQ